MRTTASSNRNSSSTCRPEYVEIYAYCLMPNHYHFLVRLAAEFDYSKAMQHFGISYAKSINSWYGRAGHLFQGRFRAKHVTSAEYLLHLSRYIHLNPVLAKLAKRAEDWEYSSYREYLHCENPEITALTQGQISGFRATFSLRTEVILSHFSRAYPYKAFVESLTESEGDDIGDRLWRLSESP